MKKLLFIIISTLLPLAAFADGYTALWQQVKDARKKDLPKTEIAALRQIAAKATKEKQYGHLLKAQCLMSAAEIAISPDSTDKNVAALEKSYARAADPALKAVYAAVAGRVYEELANTGADSAEAKSREWYQRALADPAVLAAHRSKEYEPAVVNGADSKMFGGDLLHVVGLMAADYKTLHDYYAKAGNRAAACYCALKDLQKARADGLGERQRLEYLQSLDSLIDVYGDLPEAGLVAIERYDVFSATDNPDAEQCVSYINRALGKWGSLPQMNTLRNRLGSLQQPTFEIEVAKEQALPGKPIKVAITSIRSIGTLYINVYKLNVSGNTHLDPQQSKDFARLKPLMAAKPSFTAWRSYMGLPAWKTSTDSVEIIGLPTGVYMVEATTDNAKIKPQRTLLRVSNLFLMRQGLPGNSIRYVVVNATTGAPVAGAHISLTTRGGNSTETKTLTTDNNGETVYKYAKNRPLNAWPYTDADRACNEQYAYADYSYWEGGEKVAKRIQAFTNRSIYRPGQTVHATAIAWTAYKDSLKSKADGGLQVKFTLRDANYKVAGEKTVATDGYGTASADFVLPSAGLTGNFQLQVSATGRSGGSTFSVEEYKRPTFQVSFDKYNAAYHAGDTIGVRGVATTYSGVPVQGARVAYTVKRTKGLRWWWRGEAQQIASDTVMTAADGSFTVRVPMLYPDNETMGGAVYYNFDLSAKVTDMAGETHEATTSLPLSNRTGMLASDLPAQALNDSLRQMRFTYKNLLGEEVDGQVKYRFDGNAWQTTNTQHPTPVALKSGLHTLEAACGTDTLRQQVVVFSYADKRPATVTDDWFYLSGLQFPADGKPIYMQFGSSAIGTQLYWAVCSGNKLLASGTRAMSNEVVTRKLQYKAEYGDGLTVSLAWVVNGRLYSHSESILKAEPDTKLRLSWKTFRNKLTPGQKETWTLHIASPDGKPAKAQLLATMYDKSLDAIRPHRWLFHNGFRFNAPYVTWVGMGNGTLTLDGYQPYKTLSEPSLSFSHFDTDMFEWQSYRLFNAGVVALARNEVMRLDSEVRPEASTLATTRALGKKSKAMMGAKAYDVVATADSGNEGDGGEVQVRENLNETAFFYPTLATNAAGDVDITFTLPESVTTWRLMGIAHDSLMNYGLGEAEAVASKAIMVQPNMPRFLREGDNATISTRIFNTTGKDVSGKVRLEILDPETEKTLATEETTFSVAGNGTATETFDVNPSAFAKAADGQTLFVARVVAEGDGFSDGEQQFLPVLPDREMVVNTIPFYQNEPGVKTVDLTKLFPADSKDRRLTVEYTANPVWLVLQALPTVANPSDNNAMSLATAVYANAIGRMILTSSPKIAQTIKLWQQEQGDATSLTSSLEKNAELKTIVLDETPWVADAERETDQKRQLAGFLDETTINYRITDFTNKLMKLQNADGSFAWWPGMGGSTYMTMAVVETLVRLNTIVASSQDTNHKSQISNHKSQISNLKSQIEKAFSFLDKKMAEEVAELKKQAKKGAKGLQPSETACHWLYASALANRAATADMQYLVNLLDQMPTSLTIYGKAGAAVILAQYGRTKHAQEYLQSIREYTVYKDELGRYFDTPRAQYSWFDYRIPTQAFAIEALHRLAPADTTTIAEMQRWLLHEKRTTGWNTPINAVNAVYAFSLGNSNLKPQTSNLKPQIKLDGDTLPLPKATAGIGYVKVAVPVASATISPSPLERVGARCLTIEKTSTGTSWGAVYGRFLQKATKVGNAASGLKVSREIIVEGNKKSQISNLKSQPLSVGDKVTVRITITADRDYDFVQVQDKRAACLEPAGQLSGYHWGYYCAPRDNATNYYFDRLAKGKHVVETTYYVDREGDYATGICTVQCAYAPEFSGREAAKTLNVNKQ